VVVPIFSDSQAKPTPQIEVARAINSALEEGAHVINISGGELSDPERADPMLLQAIRNCQDQRVLIVAAAGNDACRCLHVPASLPSVLAVGALDQDGLPLASSNWGAAYQTQGILAPGHNIPGAVPGGGLALKTGTSFATPLVSGIVGLLLSLHLQHGEMPNPHAVRDALLASAVPCDQAAIENCERFLVGSLSIPAAHALVSNGGNEMSDQNFGGDAALPGDGNRLGLSDSNGADESGGNVLVAAESGMAASEAEGVEIRESDAVENRSTGTPPRRATLPNVISGGSSHSHDPLAAAPRSAAVSRVKAASVEPSCACQGNGSRSMVFAIGVLGYDFGTEARRDAFKQLMPSVSADGIPTHVPEPPPYPPNPYDARQLVNYLAGFPPPDPPFPTEGGFPRLNRQGPAFPLPEVEPREKKYPGFPAHLAEAAELIWTLNIELTPVYAIRPVGGFAAEVYQRLVAALAGQILNPGNFEYVERVSVPGFLTGETVRLFSGQVVPVLEPQVRGFYAWNTNILLEAALSTAKVKATSNEGLAVAEGVRQFLNRVYFDLRNLGQTSAERALNFTATNAFQAAEVFIRGFKAAKATLDSIVVEKSPFCRMDSDCWDVKFIFFDPENERRSRKVFRYTVDVSAVFPVTIGPVREWDISSFGV
jgi:hypothetical protein